MKLSELRNLLSEMDFHPSRALGQNFLSAGVSSYQFAHFRC